MSPSCARAGADAQWVRDETCPVSTEGWTRPVQLVREGGGEGTDLFQQALEVPDPRLELLRPARG